MEALGVSLYPQGMSTANLVELGALVEAHGYDSVFVVEAGISKDAMATAQAIALATNRITIGTGIANLYLRHPGLLGASAVAIDELSGGRFIMGIGVNNEALVTALGLSWQEPRQVLRETTEWLRQVFTGGTRDGTSFTFERAQPIRFPFILLD